MLSCAAIAVAQIVTPVKWTSKIVMTDDTHGVVNITATIDKGWHIYGLELPDGGPVPTSVEWKTLNGVKLDGKLKPSRAAHEEHDKTFDMNLKWWSDNVTFTQPFVATQPNFDLKGSVRFMACNDVTCLAPETEVISVKGTAKTEAKPEATDSAVAQAPDSVPAPAPLPSGDVDTWAPVDFAAAGSAAGNAQVSQSSVSLWTLFWLCFLGGLLALLTPCVWPIIPMTVSFFLKKSGSRARAISNAVIYGLAIVVIYVALGLIVTSIYGASALNALATNAVFNIIFFVLLVVFAISFFGAFDIKLPESWANRMDRAAENTTGLLSIFFMAFTLVLVSFSCTGPIIGTLLVEAATQGSHMGPAVGMLGFSLALAIPFSLFALFPSALKKMPKSGGWLNTVKVVLGFIELALSLKFLSVADLAYGWHILDREVFLALWIVIFGLLGVYLLGGFRFKSDSAGDGSIGVTRFFLGLISLAFTVYLVPGLWGAPLRATSAFVPPLYTQDFNLYDDGQRSYDDFDAGLEAARRSGKAVFLDFSGYGCVNCRKMEGAVLDLDEVKKKLADDFITIQLMVDDKTEMPQSRFVEENGKQVELITYGDLWSYLQRHKFGANSQPYYVVLNDRGDLLSGPFFYKEDKDEFMKFLTQGLEKNK